MLADQMLYQLLFGTPAPPLFGEAVRQAKNSSSDPDVRETWNLIGDPETRLRLPDEGGKRLALHNRSMR